MKKLSLGASLMAPVAKSPPANAGNTSSIPDPGGIPMLWGNVACAPHLWSLCSRACSPQLLSPHAATTGGPHALEPFASPA